MLWVKGEAGKGKTMMSIGLVNELEAEEASGEWDVSEKKRPASITTYFFCQNADAELNTVEAIIKGLIRRLVWRRPDLVRFIRQHWDAKDNKFDPDFDREIHKDELGTLWNMLKEMLSDCHFNHVAVFILIDALDECHRGMSELLQKIVRDDPNFKGGTIKWLLTSRPHPELEDCLRMQRNRVHVSLELNAYLVNKGIEYYIDDRMRDLPLYNKATISALKELIIRKANGTFLWVSFVCQELQKTLPSDAMASVRALPIDLHQFYEQAYDRCCIDDAVLGTHYADMLNMLMLAYRPLRSSELAILLGVSDRDAGAQGFSSGCSTFLRLRSWPPRQIEHRGDQYVDFVHESARDYLKTLVQSPDGRQESDHEKMVQRCLTILSSPRSNPSPEPLLEIDNKQAVLRRYNYVALAWVLHLKQVSMPFLARIAGTENGMLDKLLRDHFFEWLALAPSREFYMRYLTKRLDDLAKDTNRCLKVARRSQYHKILQRLTWIVPFLEDAYRSIDCYEARAGQLDRLEMASYLVFNPESSTVKKSYINRLPEFFKRIPKMELNWEQIENAPLLKSEFLGFSRDGRLLVLSSWETDTVHIFATNTGKVVSKLEGRLSEVVVMALSPDGELIAVGSWTRVRVWDIATGKPLREFKEHTKHIVGVNFSPSGTSIISISNEGAIKVWNVWTGVVDRRLLVANFDAADDTLSLALSAGESLLAIAYLGSKRLSKSASTSFNIQIITLASQRWSGNKYVGKLLTPLVKASHISTIQCKIVGPQLDLYFDHGQLVVNREIVSWVDSDQSVARSVSTPGPHVKLESGCQSICDASKTLLPIPDVWKADCYHYHDGHLTLATNSGYVLKFEIGAETRSITPSPKSSDTRSVKGPQYSEMIGPLKKPYKKPYLFSGNEAMFRDPTSWQSES